MPLPFMRGFGVGGLIIPTVSVIAALTFLPVLLSLVGRRLERVRLLPKALMDRRADHEHGFWARLAHWIMRRPWPVAIGTTAFLLAARRSGVRAAARAGLERGHPEEPRVGAGPRRPRGGGRRGRHRADRDRDRHRAGGRSAEPGGRRRRGAPAHGPRGRPAGGARRLPGRGAPSTSTRRAAT